MQFLSSLGFILIGVLKKIFFVISELHVDSSDLCTASSQFPAKLKKSSSKSSSSLGSSKSTSSSESKSKKRKGSASSDGKTDHVTGIGGRDCSLFLFRALGKILYSKRELTYCSLLGETLSYLPPISMDGLFLTHKIIF